MILWKFKIEGKVKPAVRMTQRSKYVDPQAQQYLASKDAIRYQLIEQMGVWDRQIIPKGIPIYIGLYFYHTKGFHNKDLDNQVKAVLDAAEGIVFENDRWVDQLDSQRSKHEDEYTMLYVGYDHEKE